MQFRGRGGRERAQGWVPGPNVLPGAHDKHQAVAADNIVASQA